MADGLSAAFLGETRRFWRERTGESVSEDDARQAIRNVASFLDLLASWDMPADDGVQVEDQDQ